MARQAADSLIGSVGDQLELCKFACLFHLECFCSAYAQVPLAWVLHQWQSSDNHLSCTATLLEQAGIPRLPHPLVCRIAIDYYPGPGTARQPH